MAEAGTQIVSFPAILTAETFPPLSSA